MSGRVAMPDLLLPLVFEVSAPETTTVQRVIAAFVIVLLVSLVTVVRWRMKVWGLTDAQQETREEANSQRLRQTPRMDQIPSSAIAAGEVNLQARIRGLFAAETPAATHTTARGALAEVYRAISVAWGDRLEPVPRLARRTAGLAVTVAILGAIAVSTSAVVAIITHDPGSLTLSDVLSTLGTITETGHSLLASFPYAGILWALAFTVVIMTGEWLYTHWYVVAGGLLLSAVGIAVLDWRLEDVDVPERMGASPWGMAMTGLGILTAVWTTGTAVATVGRVAGYPQVGNLAGFGLAVLVAVGIAAKVLPWIVGAIRWHIRTVAGHDAGTALAYLLAQRVIAAVSVVAGLLAVMYALVGVADGKFARVGAALLRAPPETQAAVSAALAAGAALAAYTVADSWRDVATALHAAVAQKAVRAQLARRAIPGMVVFFSYVMLHMLTEAILASLILAVIVGVVAQKGIKLATTAAYYADTESIVKRLVRPEPIYVGILAYELEVDGRTYYLAEVNGDRYLADEVDEAVSDVTGVARSLATNEKVPSTDSEWFAEFLLDKGIADPDDWEQKLDERIREHAFDKLRSDGPQLERETFDKALNDFAEERVDARLHADDMAPFITLGPQYVALSSRDPHERRDDWDWPSLSA